MELAAKQYLEYIRVLTQMLREAGVTDYVTPGLSLKLDSAPRLDVAEVEGEHKPAPTPGGYHHPSLWADGKPPVFPKG